MPEKLVIALGGNALQSKDSPPTAEAQLEVVRSTVRQIAQLSRRGYEMALVHGNGPQVGRILLASETARDTVPPMPFDVCGAMSQGYIGYHIQQALKYALSAQGRNFPVVSLTTQMVVDAADPAFSEPTKPIGGFCTEEEAHRLEQEKGYRMREDAGRGWRRVVASPMPRRIVEIDAVRLLWDHAIVITCGGGGVPVAENPDGTLEGVAAVIDKDRSASMLAAGFKADMLVILTAVEKVCVNFGKPDQKALDHMTPAEAHEYIEQGQFAPGSMLPKVEACLDYVAKYPQGRALITSLECAAAGLRGETGTVISNE